MLEDNLTLRQVREKYRAGPDSGVFTDGSASPNPGPGGWGVVFVKNGEVISQRHGSSPQTTNNRMELTALIEAFKFIPKDEEIVVYSDSDLCVKTLTQWASMWEKRGWKRKTGPVQNLDLVKEAYYLLRDLPKVKVKWIKAHNGWLWNEYADSLATAWMRGEV